MDALQFISSLVESLTWPVVVVVLVLVLRSPLSNLLRTLTSFRYGDMEMNFEREVRELEHQAKAAGLNVPEKLTELKPRFQNSAQIVADATRLASEFPGPAVGLAWTAVEHELMQAVMRLAITAQHPPTNAPIENIELLYKEEHLDSDSRGLLDRMRRLRNAAVHPSRGAVWISADEAREFIALTVAITEKLKSLNR